MRVLTIVMQSQQFDERAAKRDVRGVTIHPYSQQFADLVDYVHVAMGGVTSAAPL